jgi:hypothetical protein
MSPELFESHVRTAAVAMGSADSVRFIGTTEAFRVAMIESHATAGRILIANTDPQDTGLAMVRVGFRGPDSYQAGDVVAPCRPLRVHDMARLGSLGLSGNRQQIVTSHVDRADIFLGEPIEPYKV